MRKLVITTALLAALASISTCATMPAIAAAPTTTTATPKVAPAPAAIEAWYIRGIETIGGVKSETRYTQQDQSGVFVALFPSKKECEDARTKAPRVVGLLAQYAAGIKEKKGTVVISCVKWVHPVTPDEPAAPKGESI